jgi:hypothetical protein
MLSFEPDLPAEYWSEHGESCYTGRMAVWCEICSHTLFPRTPGESAKESKQ